MGIDLHDILANPERTLSFHRALSTERLSFPAVLSYLSAPVGEGTIRSDAGALSLHGRITADMLCVCDRCAREFSLHKEVPLDVSLAAELQDEESPDYYLLSGEELDIDELLESCFILAMDTRFLCRPDCRGLCEKCGADLNEGPCGCARESDPRLAVLEQLLDDKE